MPPQEPNDARWFADHVQPHESDLRAYLRRRFPSLTDVDDMVQESFMRLLRARAAGGVASPRPYLFTIARNIANALLRRPRIFTEKPLTDHAVLRIVEGEADVAERVSANQEIALLLEAIEALPSRCREIFILRKLQGLPQKEIALRLGLSEQTVQVQIARGAKKCGEFLRSRGVTGRLSTPTRAPNSSHADD